MERRRALVVAGTMTATLAMAGTAMAVNLGLLGTDSDPVGNLSATDIQPAAEQATPDRPEPRVRVIVQDIPVGGSSGSSSAGVEQSDASVPTATAASDDDSSYSDDSDDEDSSYSDDSDDEDSSYSDDDHDELEDHDGDVDVDDDDD